MHRDNRGVSHDKVCDSKYDFDQAKVKYLEQIPKAKWLNIEFNNHRGVVNKKREWRKEALRFSECIHTRWIFLDSLIKKFRFLGIGEDVV